ncbi:hypothetical protein AgCh_029196 [Apium graveolens]
METSSEHRRREKAHIVPPQVADVPDQEVDQTVDQDIALDPGQEFAQQGISEAFGTTSRGSIGHIGEPRTILDRYLRSENQSLMKDKEPQQNPPPPPAISHINNKMSRYEAIKVLILKIHEYPIWKVKMTMCLEAIDLEYLRRIYDGPHRPMKLAVTVVGQEEKMVDKPNKDYTVEDLSSIMKDARTHELEMEKRCKRKGSKSRPIALIIEEKPKGKSRRKDTDSESYTDSDHANNEDIEQMAALLVESFKKMVNKKFKKGKRKPKTEKKQYFITKKKKWDDSSDSDDGVNYALMANTETEADTAELNVT